MVEEASSRLFKVENASNSKDGRAQEIELGSALDEIAKHKIVIFGEATHLNTLAVDL